ncbi:hypothetical protein [Stenotrophomonas sp. 278]|uniref:hypothetical protein n=1 Tax=Stenotrophomonas sp. 278 TaxID=2479851 RepID=UPI000F68D3F3|nr:hypothetical protein [Stenotrophomonas sp. 278]RRU03702.1 hypothetical protein EGJ34_19235 [Stenotrophomonas sp. 278]
MRANHYSLMRGGLVHRLLHASGTLQRTRHLSVWLAVLLLVLALVPLLLLTAQAGTLWPTPDAAPGHISLLADYDTLARLLIALPLLVLTAPRADALLRGAVRQLTRSHVVHAVRAPRLEALLDHVRTQRDSWLPEAVCLVLAFAPAWSGAPVAGVLPGLDDWRFHGGSPSAAGLWYSAVAVPLLRLLLLLWFWRFLLWTLVLWRLPQVGLDLHPQHPDRAGGLAFLGRAQMRFSPLAAAGGIMLAGAFLNQMLHQDQTLFGLRHLIAGYVIGSTLLLISPLLLLAPALIHAKRHALYRFDALGSRAARVFDQRWRVGGETRADGDSLLDHNDASAYCDFGGVYQGVSAMRVIPLSRWNLLGLALPALAPMLPLLLVAMSVDELVAKLMGLLA